jgi:hypothetical protein
MTGPPTDDWTLKATRDWTREQVKGGGKVPCPCCRQNVKIYPRRVSAGIARWLIGFYQLGLTREGGWVHWTEVGVKLNAAKSGVDYSIPKHWGLIEPRIKGEDDEPHKKTSGFWRLTLKGLAYVLNRLSIQKIAYVYDDRLQKFGGPQLYILDALADKFDYRELMAAIVPPVDQPR